MIMNEV